MLNKVKSNQIANYFALSKWYSSLCLLSSRSFRIAFFLVSNSNSFLSSSSWATLLLVCRVNNYFSIILFCLSKRSYSFLSFSNLSRSISKSFWAIFAFSWAVLCSLLLCSSETEESSWRCFSYYSLEWVIWVSIYYFLLLLKS